MKNKVSPQQTTYQLHASLFGIEPPVWRRLLVRGSMTLRHLHDILQIAFGWEDCHLHAFRTKDENFMDPDMNPGTEAMDEKKAILDQVLLKVKSALIYEYDFGDGWEHNILLEKILPFDVKQKLPICLGGERSGPPEDCGGFSGYEVLLEAIKNPDHPEHEEMLDWVGEDFDPEYFNLNEINKELANLYHKKKKR
jgi:hypothetical protein